MKFSKLCNHNAYKGLYQYTHMPYVVVSAPAIFQKVMDTIDSLGYPHVICYILMTFKGKFIPNLSSWWHLGHKLKKLRPPSQPLSSLSASSAWGRDEECQVQVAEELTWVPWPLYIHVEGLHITASKLKAVACAPVPQNVCELRSFLELLIYYRERSFLICPPCCIHWIVCCSKDDSGSRPQIVRKWLSVPRNLSHLPMC